MTAKRWPYLAHLPVVLFLFSGVLFEGRVPFFRDLLTHYYPDYVFLARAASQGVFWPLWNPMVHAGSAFLMPYPIDLLSVHLFGPLNALRLDAPIHVLLAMCGASFLASRRGLAASGIWATGLFYGLSGFLLSSSNSMQFFHAAAWAPWVVAALLGVFAAPDARRSALLALLLALQLSTLAADVVLQTALVALALLPGRPSLRQLAAWSAAAAGAALIAAPVLLGTIWLLEGTRRALGFEPGEALAWSASPLVLLEAAIPHLFGNVRSFSDLGYWGKPFFEQSYPYFMSLYLGPGLLLLAALAGFERRTRALWLLVLLGLLLSLGAHGPLGSIQAVVLRNFRFPIKFFFVTSLALCLLAGEGVARAGRGGVRSPLRFLPGLAFLAAAGLLMLEPGLPSRLFGGLVPELLGAGARFTAQNVWPGEFLRTGALCLAAAVAMRLKKGPGTLAAALVALDMLAANLVLNPAAQPDFYELAPALRAVVARTAQAGPYRWLSLSLNTTEGVPFQGWAAIVNSDVVAYRAARQSLLGTSNVLDGLESAIEVEDSFAPPGATLPRELRTVERFREFFPAVRLANVRWVLSVLELPGDLVRRVTDVAIPGLAEPLRFHEVVDPLERAFWTSRCEVIADAAQARARALGADFDPKRAVILESAFPELPCERELAEAPAEVRFEQPDPHTVRLQVRSPPGFVVVIQGFHRDWRARGPAGAVPLVRGDGWYWALPTPGGEQTFEITFHPRWPTTALSLSGLGLALAAVALARGGRTPG